MADMTGTEVRLLSGYKSTRTADGYFVLVMPWPMRPVIGCAGGTLAFAIGAAVIFGNESIGMSVFACLFAVIVILVVVFQNRHAWVLRAGLIKPVSKFHGISWSERPWLAAQSVELKREIWPGERGSTDIVSVITGNRSPLKLVSVYNWEGRESRLGSGGYGSLARSGPKVAEAPAPLVAIADSNLVSAGQRVDTRDCRPRPS